MIALIRKELRENLRWALLFMVVLGGALYYGLRQSRDGYNDYYYYEGITLCKTSFLMMTSFGFAGVGLLLGLLQILPELKRDRWAALLHRPVSRNIVLAGKAVSGVMLYLLATAVPFFLVVRLVATPGIFPVPFVAGMILPGAADLCVGLVYYFAALIIGLQRGGTVLLRLLPFFAALHVSYFCLSAGLFRVAVEAAALMVLAMLLAAWGVIGNQDSLRARPWLCRAAFVGVALYGACGLGDLSLSLVRAVAHEPPDRWSRYELADNGIPLCLTVESGVIVSVTKPDGSRPSERDYQPDRVDNHTRSLNTVSSYIGDSHGWKLRERIGGYRESPTYLTAFSPYQYPRMEQWFYLVEERAYIGYFLAKKEPIARLGKNGFVPIAGQAEPFPKGTDISYWRSDLVYISNEKSLRLAKMPNQELTEVPLPGAGPIYGIGNAYASTGRSSVNVIGVALQSGMAVYEDKGALLAMLPYSQDIDRWGMLGLGINGAKDRFYLWYQASIWIDGKIRKAMPSYVDEMDAEGKVLRSFTLPALPRTARPPALDWLLATRLQGPAFFFGQMAYQKIGMLLGSKRLGEDLAGRFGNNWPRTREISIWISAISLVLAGLTLAWARWAYFAWPRALAWAVFVLAFNLAGLVAFRLVADWPYCVRCLQCAGRRPVEREKCPCCGTGWLEPEASGTEIFERAEQGAKS